MGARGAVYVDNNVKGVHACPSQGLEEIWPCSSGVGGYGCRSIGVGGSERDGPVADRYAVKGIDQIMNVNEKREFTEHD